jgi:hypothetical protein
VFGDEIVTLLTVGDGAELDPESDPHAHASKARQTHTAIRTGATFLRDVVTAR